MTLELRETGATEAAAAGGEGTAAKPSGKRGGRREMAECSRIAGTSQTHARSRPEPGRSP